MLDVVLSADLKPPNDRDSSELTESGEIEPAPNGAFLAAATLILATGGAGGL